MNSLSGDFIHVIHRTPYLLVALFSITINRRPYAGPRQGERPPPPGRSHHFRSLSPPIPCLTSPTSERDGDPDVRSHTTGPAGSDAAAPRRNAHSADSTAASTSTAVRPGAHTQPGIGRHPYLPGTPHLARRAPDRLAYNSSTSVEYTVTRARCVFGPSFIFLDPCHKPRVRQWVSPIFPSY
jgi:hypothetical protein